MSTTKKTLLAILSLMLIAVAIRGYYALHSQPQLPASDEVFKTVDALFTAVTAHDTHRLTLCQQRLEQYKQRGSLTGAAAKRLDGIVAVAQSGDWESAARRLYDFMQAQRRDAPVAPAKPVATAMVGQR